MAVGLTVLWLIGYELRNFRGFIRFFLAFGLMIFISFLGIITYFPEFSEEAYIFLTFCAFVSGGMLLAISITTKLCKRQYRPIAFMLWLAVFMIFFLVFVMFGLVVVVVAIIVPGPLEIMEAIVQITLIGLLIGIFAYLLNLPYFILGFISPFFRERFYNLLRIENVSTRGNNGNTDENIKQDARECGSAADSM